MLVIHKISLIQPLPESYLGRIATIDGVADISHMSWFGGVYQDPRNFFAQFAVDPESYLRLYPEVVLSDAEREAWLRNRTGAIVGRATADRFGWEVGDRIPIQGTIFRTRNGPTWEFTIDGIYEAGVEGYDTSTFYFHHEYLMEANALGQRFHRPVHHPHRRSRAVGRRRGRRRRPLRQLAGRDPDLDRAGVPARIRRPDRQHRGHRHRGAVRGLLHDSGESPPIRWRSRSASAPASWRC